MPEMEYSTLTRLSMFVNRIRGGRNGLTVCEEEWERRLKGERLASVNVKLLDLTFKLIRDETNHCYRDYLKRRGK